MGPGFVQCQILVIWGPCEPPMLVAPQAQAENLKTAGSRCEAQAAFQYLEEKIKLNW